MNENTPQYAGPKIGGHGQPTKSQGSGLLVPRAYAEEMQQSVSERSLQINIDSEDDAKSVIQNLESVRQAYNDSGCSSVEFCIADTIVRQVDGILTGAINWCRTYIKHIAPNPGNVLFPLPSFRDMELSKKMQAPRTTPLPPQTQAVTSPAPAPVATHVKPPRPVNAASAAR